MSDELPEGWASARLNDLLEPGGLFDGPFGSSLKSSDYTDAGVRVIRLENLANLRFVEDKETFVSEAKYKTLTKHTVVSGDIMVGSFVDGAVRVCVLPELRTKAIAKADCFTVRTRQDAAERRFIAFQLGTVAIRDAFVGDIHGATRPRITTKQLRDCELAVAPLPEQRRIVTQVEALLEQVKRAKGRLDRVPLILKRFRQAVLAAACSGELTKEWRDGADADWPEKTLDAVCASITDGDHQAPPKAAEGIPFITISAINDGELHLDRATRFVPQAYFSNLKADRRPALGDILYSVTGSIGIPALVNTNKPFVFQRHIAILKPDVRQISSRFLRYRLETQDIKKQGEEVATGTAQMTIPLGGLRSLTFSLPPLEEQAEIVRQVDRLFALADTIERRVQAATARADKLPQAILSKAFSGELVPTEAELARTEGRTYETAEELLKRVSASATTAGSGAKARRRGAKRTA